MEYPTKIIQGGSRGQRAEISEVSAGMDWHKDIKEFSQRQYSKDRETVFSGSAGQFSTCLAPMKS